MSPRFIEIATVWLAMGPVLSLSISAEQSEQKRSDDRSTEEVIAGVRGKIGFMREEIAYLQDKYGSHDERWREYKKHADDLTSSFEEQLGTPAGVDKSTWIEMEEELDALHGRIPLTLPSGPAGPGHFGAFYTHLKYSLSWDRRWRTGQHADVVVRFDSAGYKLVFWRGTSYVPCWVTENDIWYSNEFCETADDSTEGSCEPISDKQCRYSHVRILESHDARTVVHWRYALTDIHYELIHEDPVTAWHDWADETYTVYPDGVAVRKIVLWSSRPDLWHEFQEAIVINQPGTKPDDNIRPCALTVANLKGESKEYCWTENGAPPLDDRPKDACIETINLASRNRPFLIVPPEGASIASFGGNAPGSRFNCWDHWPVSQDASNTRVAMDFDRPSHSSLSWVVTPRKPATGGWIPYETTDKSITKLLLNGMTDRSAAELAPLGKSWLRAPKLELHSEGFTSQGYDQAERAYLLTRREAAKPSELRFVLAADEEHPMVNPALVVKGWGDHGVSVKIDGLPVRRGKTIRIGHRKGLEGIDLIVWIRRDSAEPVRIELAPATQ